ncbi:hypothetical protein DV735_g822, partial [Chaetothyriales sp. CBS 134920]
MAGDHGAVARFDRVLNFRDVGEFVRPLKRGLLYRSAQLDDATPSDRSTLTNRLNLTTVIDLRSTTEHIIAAKKHADGIPGLDYAEINLNGRAFERALVWQLKYSSLARLLFLMALGYRREGIAVLSQEIMVPRGLTGLGIDTLNYSGPEIKQIFDILANQASYPVLVHCTQGKDRTGISILLVLLLCGAAMEDIVKDYRRSELELESDKDERLKEIAKFGLDESFVKCPPDFCDGILSHLETKFGGVGKYLESIGVDEPQQAKIRSILEYQQIPYISDVGAFRLKPLFIAASAVMVVTFNLSFLAERWLRHNGRLAPNTGFQRTVSLLSIFFTVVGAVGLILLTIFDTYRHNTVHHACLGLFIGGYVVSAILVCIEYQRLGVHYRQFRILRLSFWTKLGFIVVEVALGIVFAVYSSTSSDSRDDGRLVRAAHKRDVAAATEWSVAFVFTLYVLSYIIDLLPAIQSRNHIPQGLVHSNGATISPPESEVEQGQAQGDSLVG